MHEIGLLKLTRKPTPKPRANAVAERYHWVKSGVLKLFTTYTVLIEQWGPNFFTFFMERVKKMFYIVEARRVFVSSQLPNFGARERVFTHM